MPWQQEYLDRFYHHRSGWADGTTEFHRLCAHHLDKADRILEVGAGPSNRTSRFLAELGKVYGVDLDSEVLSNDALSTAAVIDREVYPHEDDWFDGAVSNYVVEHISDPLAHLREVRRVLKPNAFYLIRTPNLYHYVGLMAALTPHWFHRLVANRLRRLGPGAHEPYPCVYRMNSASTVSRLAARADLRLATLRFVEKEPSYAMYSRAMFLAGMAYERLVNSCDLLRGFRSNLFVVLRKQPAVVCMPE